MSDHLVPVVVEQTGRSAFGRHLLWRRRFASAGVEGLLDEPCPGRPRTVGDDTVEEIVLRTLGETPPNGDTHWSNRTMARRAGVSRETVGRIWRAFGLKPHLTETFELSTGPQFIEKVRDVVGLYLDPPEHAVVLCVGERSQDAGPGPDRPGAPPANGRHARAADPRLRPPGVTSVFAALNTASGEVIGSFHRRRHQEFGKLLKTIDAEIPGSLGASPRSRPADLDRTLERRSPAVRMAQDRRRDPGTAGCLLHSDR